MIFSAALLFFLAAGLITEWLREKKISVLAGNGADDAEKKLFQVLRP